MSLQIRTYVNGNQEFIDLYGNENIDIEISFAEIQDITKKNSAFTKEFKVPGTKNNNNIFNYFYDINAVALSWNPKKKFEADLLYDGYELYNGYVRMNAVTINKLETIYSVTFYSAVGDLASNIGDKGLCELDTSSLNHSLYDTEIVSGLLYDPSLHPPASIGLPENPVNTGDVNYNLGQRGYAYTGSTFADIRDINIYQTPLLDFSGVTGFFDFSGTPIISSYLIPSIRTRKLYELIVNQSGYQLESDFFETDYFGRYYIPLSFNTESPYMAQSRAYEYEWINSSGYTSQITQGVNFFGGGGVYNLNLLKPQQIVRENLGFNPITYAEYSAQTPSISGITDYLFALPYTNGNDFVYDMSITNVYSGSCICCLDPFACGDFVGTMYLMEYLYHSGSTIVGRTAASVPFYGFDNMTGAINTFYYTGQTQNTTNRNGTGLYFMAYEFSQPDFYITGASFNLISTPRILPKTIRLNEEMSCDQKQIEFIQNINKTFNLVVVEHPVKPNTIIVEPIVNYIGKGKLLDWTDKVDYDSPQTLRPTTSLINGSIFLSNKIDKDYINTEYNKRSNLIFGQRTIDLDIDYKNATINLTQTLAQNTDYYLNASGSTNVAIPCYFITRENNVNGRSVFEYKPFRSLPRQIFKSIPLPSGNTAQNYFFYRYAGSNNPFTSIGLSAYGTIPNVNRLTTYPFALSGFSHYTIYNATNKFTDDELVYDYVDTMYDRYYREYVEDLISEENKIYSCKMQLNPWDVSQLYFNETILIKNAKFRINKISNLSLTDENSLSDVELVKLTRDYEPTPTLFYDLINCDNPCDVMHSSTDDSYLLWAFENKYVDIWTGTTTVITSGGEVIIPTGSKRMKVVRTDYNPNYIYEKPYFQIFRDQTFSFYIFSDYASYNSCSDSRPNFTLDIRNTFTGSTSTFDCYTLNITNTGTTRQTFYFTNCSGDTSSWTLDNGESITTCGLYGSLDTPGFKVCISGFTGCTGSTPLPTPTPTATPFASPTPTPSPTATIGITTTPTASITPTPSNRNCKVNAQLNVTEPGWIKYNLCDGTIYYDYISVTGTYFVVDCYQVGTLIPGFPYADIANFSIVNAGTSC